MPEIKIFWRNNEIGIITAEETDMWYCNCKWIPNGSDEAIEFKKLASNFNPKEVMNEPVKGTRVVLKPADSNESTNALILSLENDDLFMRYIYDEAAVNWLEKNVY